MDAQMEPKPHPLRQLDADQLRRTSAVTLTHYNDGAEAFWQGTRGHDVSQNVAALLRHLPGPGPHTILDFGCGPGRDLITFRDLGHEPVGLDGAERFVRMARANSTCEVLHQDFLRLDLPQGRFHGIFANASLFHVPSQELPRVLAELQRSLAVDGVLFSSNPHGPNREGWSGDRYSCYLDLPTYRAVMTGAGFEELEHYYRPTGKPRHLQPWLASVWRKVVKSSDPGG
jgi:SAM-dependent methyltransferase